MIYLQLFFSFLKVGSFAFGGGYAMLSLIGEAVMSYGWMTQEDFLSFLGVETLIPGPIVINMATYVGYQKAGFLGALLTTVGVVLPSFVIILIVAAFIRNLLKYPPVKVFITSMRPALSGLLAAVAVTMALTVFLGIDTIQTARITWDWRSFLILAVVIAVPALWSRHKKKEFSSILLVTISGILGMLLF